MAVYFVQSVIGGPIKIGSSVDPPERLAQLQACSPFELQILCTIDGGVDVEKGFHYRLARSRLHGEWFVPTDELVSLIEAAGGHVLSPTRWRAKVTAPPDPRYAWGIPFGLRLRIARQQRGLTASRLSRDAGLAQAHVGMIERNHLATPRASTAVKLAEALRVSLEWLITGEGRMVPASTDGTP